VKSWDPPTIDGPRSFIIRSSLWITNPSSSNYDNCLLAALEPRQTEEPLEPGIHFPLVLHMLGSAVWPVSNAISYFDQTGTNALRSEIAYSSPNTISWPEPCSVLQKRSKKKARVGSAVSDSDSSVQSSSDTFRCHSFWNWRFFCQIIRCPCEKPSQERGKGRVRGGTDIQSNRTIDPALQEDKHNESKHLARHSNKPYI